MYYVAETGDPHILAIVDANTGMRKNTISIRGGVLDSSPIVMGDRCSFITIDNNNVRRGWIFKIPAGTFITDFRVG